MMSLNLACMRGFDAWAMSLMWHNLQRVCHSKLEKVCW
jgi:hypothetical protein